MNGLGIPAMDLDLFMGDDVFKKNKDESFEFFILNNYLHFQIIH